VKKLVNSKETLCLLNDGRFVSPDSAVTKVIYQLVRVRSQKILKEVQFQREGDTIDVDLQEEDPLVAITQTWGVANWKIVDGFGTPFPSTDLRDGTLYIALKEGEALQNRAPARSYSCFTVNKVSDEVRFMIKCGNQVQHVCMKPFAAWKVMETCISIWGPE
jgi:hypothetical protein